jgi:ribosomal protein S18 acetylase RimI-like enzyme
MSLRYNIKKTKIETYIYFKPTESNDLDEESNDLDNIKFLLEDDDKDHDKLYIYPNNEDVNPYNSYKNVTDYIYRIINNAEFLCKGLPPDYILQSFDNVDAVVIIGSSMNILPNGNIFGFALITFEGNHTMYIDVICSHIGIKGAGDILINEIEYIARKLLMTEIYLESVKSAISFYEKYGFTKQKKSCDDMCIMIKSIKKKSGGKKIKTKKKKNGGKKRKTNKKINKNKKTRKNGRFK